MPDERRKKVKVVVGGESSCNMDGSGATPDVRVPLFDHCPRDLPLVHAAVVSKEARRRVEDEGTEVDDESEFISVGGPLSIVGGYESEGITFDGRIGRAGLISETDTALDTTGPSIY